MKGLSIVMLALMGLMIAIVAGRAATKPEFKEFPEGEDSIITDKTKRRLPHNGHILNCYSQTAKGNYATCLPGYTATGCACGHACGSWNTVGARTCYCHIGCMSGNKPLDWTLARCCRVFGT